MNNALTGSSSLSANVYYADNRLQTVYDTLNYSFSLSIALIDENMNKRSFVTRN